MTFFRTHVRAALTLLMLVVLTRVFVPASVLASPLLTLDAEQLEAVLAPAQRFIAHALLGQTSDDMSALTSGVIQTITSALLVLVAVAALQALNLVSASTLQRKIWWVAGCGFYHTMGRHSRQCRPAALPPVPHNTLPPPIFPAGRRTRPAGCPCWPSCASTA